MSELLDAVEGLELAGGFFVVEIPVDEFDRLLQTAGSVDLPDLAIAARAESLNDAVAGDRLFSSEGGKGQGQLLRHSRLARAVRTWPRPRRVIWTPAARKSVLALA